MKILLTIFTILIAFVSYTQDEKNPSKEDEPYNLIKPTTESKVKLDSTYENYYILNELDTFFFTNNSTVTQCNFLQSLDRSHNKCMIFINQKAGEGDIRIVMFDYQTLSSSTFYGTILNGLLIEGTYIRKTLDNIPILTGQYNNNWKSGFWTTHYTDGRVESINKYIEGSDYPVQLWEFNETGELESFTDEEVEIVKRINENKKK